MENKLREIIRGLVREIQSEKELEEMTGTGAVAGYDTPNAFSKPGQTGKKNNRLAKVTGGTVVDDLEEGITSSASAPFTKPSDIATKNTKLAKLSGGTVVEELGVLDLQPEKAKPTATPAKDENDKDDEMANVSSMELVENRWLELKREDASPQKKIAVGLRSVKSQLSEIEKFVNWYSRLKTENNLDRTGYYKRTYSNLNTIKERLNKIAEKIHSM
jgi:hypothetical protein